MSKICGDVTETAGIVFVQSFLLGICKDTIDKVITIVINNSKLIHHLSKTPNALHLCADVLVTALMKFWSSIQRSSMHDCYFWDRRQSVTGEAQAHASCSNHVLVHNARNIYFLFLSKANFSIRNVYFCNAQLPSAIKRPLNFITVLKYTPWVKKNKTPNSWP